MFEYDAQLVTDNLDEILRCLEQQGDEQPNVFRDWDQFIKEANKPETTLPGEFFRNYTGRINQQRRDYAAQALHEMFWQEQNDAPIADPPAPLQRQLVDQFVVAEVADRVNIMVREGWLRPVQRDYVLDWPISKRPNPCTDFDPTQTAWPFQPPVFSNLTWQSSFQPGMWAPFAIQDQSILPDIVNSVQALTADRTTQLRFSNQTTLVRTLRGQTLSGVTPSLDKVLLEQGTQQFFREFAPAFSGSREAWVEVEESFGRVVRLRQTSPDGIPVHGGVFIASYDLEGNLTFVNNSCYPIPSLPSGDRFRISQADALAIAQVFVAKVPNSGETNEESDKLLEWETVRRGLRAEPADNFLNGEDAGKVVLPAVLVDGRVIRPQDLTDQQKERVEQSYLPAWAIAVTDDSNVQSWIVMVDGERTEGSVEERVLYWTETTMGSSITALIYPTIAHATLAALGPDLVPVGESPTGDLADAESFQLVEWSNNTELSVANPVPGQFSRQANTYFHLHQALKWFSELMPRSWPELSSAQLPMVPGKLNTPRVKVKFANINGGAQFTASNTVNNLWIGLGSPESPGDPNAQPPQAPQPPRGDPALDPEVLYHEFAHGVMNQVQPDLSNQILNSGFGPSLDEGLAFYFACSISDDLVRQGVLPALASQVAPYRWAKLARSHPDWTDKGLRDLERWGALQKADNDYLKVYGLFPLFSEGLDDPDEKTYAVGMAWARTLWDIRRVLGPEHANAIILRAARLAGGVQADLETWAEAIIHTDKELTRLRNSPAHESALRAIFAARGILADAPVRTIERVDLGGQRVFLATVEGADSGCLVSLDDGDTWQPLGNGGPGDAVALCCFPLQADEVTVFVASESWMNHTAGQNGISVYFYSLALDGQGGVILNNTWNRLPLLNSAAGIRCLAATAGNPGDSEPWLFVGAENGIYKHNGSIWQVTAKCANGQPPQTNNGCADGKPPRHVPNWLMDTPVLALKVATIDGVRRLLAASQNGLLIFDITPDTTINNKGLIASQVLPLPTVKPVLCIETEQQGQNTTRIWLGTINDGVVEMDLTGAQRQWTQVSGQWLRDKVPEPARPVFQVRAIPSGGTHILQAGTNNGVYVRAANGDWEAQSQGFTVGAETLENVSVLTLTGTDSRLLLGTGQRGMWLHQNSVWARVGGLPRVGVLSDDRDPFCNCFRSSLPASGIGSHVIFVPPLQHQSLTLSLQVTNGTVQQVNLFYIASAINLNTQHWAGTQNRTLAPMAAGNWQLVEPVLPGHYLAVVRAGAQPTVYQLDLTLV